MDKRSRSASLILLILGPALPMSAKAAPAENSLPAPSVNVRIFNYARVSSASFAKAQKEAGRIFQRTGIETNWIACAVANEGARSDPRCTAKTRATDIVVRVIPNAMADFRRQSELGVALIPLNRGFGKQASVFYNRVEEYAERWQASDGLLLGHLIAHEIGHLLLGANSHSRSGIMTAPWSRKTIERASLGTLLFTQPEATRIQRQVAARIAEGGCAGTAAD